MTITTTRGEFDLIPGQRNKAHNYLMRKAAQRKARQGAALAYVMISVTAGVVLVQAIIGLLTR